MQPSSKRDLFWSFSLLALQGFGGVLIIVQRELVDKKQWLTREAFLEEWAVAQLLPGPNVVNLAVMLGDRYFGMGGAFAALAGMLFFPLLLVLLLVALFSGIADVPHVQGALRGMGAVAAGLITGAALRLMPALRSNPMGAASCTVLGALTFVAIAYFRFKLGWVLLLLGAPACLWAYVRLRAQDAQRKRATP